MGKSPVLLSFGHGYSAQVLARRLMEQGWQVIGTTRSEEKAAAIRATGAEAVIWPHIKCGPLLDFATHILVSAGPESGSDPTLMHCAGALGARADQFDWVGYLSTTGVYGDRGGDWVNETSECTPTTERGKSRLAAEREWLAYRRETGLPVQIFRLAGIYGPGRGPFAKLRAGTARRIIKAGQVFSIGDEVTMELVGDCEACGKMEALALGLQDKIEGKRGMLAKVINGGAIKVGDSVSVN